ncbi:uncharacterized protein LOC126410690 isoform X2 [Nymphaea colorata]|uniref:uncharacterized protein LOC126410690 isoform X2 n=1 Tax=Nymphaea colorata TaxID=210225 RepID=UPI00214EA07B|nr:uncharacterized protein LOC126410690 isoform X2 [Nymphaea colorata]
MHHSPSHLNPLLFSFLFPFLSCVLLRVAARSSRSRCRLSSLLTLLLQPLTLSLSEVRPFKYCFIVSFCYQVIKDEALT